MVFAGFMIPNFFGGVLAAKFSAHRTQQVSTFAYLIVSVLLVYGVAYHQFLAFVFGGMGAGFFAGAMFNGAMRACLSRIQPAQRAVVFALIFLISYAGAGLPNLGIAFFAPNAELVNLLQGYLVLIGIMGGDGVMEVTEKSSVTEYVVQKMEIKASIFVLQNRSEK